MKNARFWELTPAGALVKITLRPGQTITHVHAARHEEGWSRTSNAYTYTGLNVYVAWASDGTDCDGRHTRAGVSLCAVNKLAAGYRNEDAGVAYPAWLTRDESQRDYTAEAMGY